MLGRWSRPGWSLCRVYACRSEVGISSGFRTALAVRCLDVPGAVLVTSGCTALTYGITMIRAGQPLASTLAVLLSGALLVVGFVVVEARFARVPLLPLGVFRVRGVAAGNVVMLLAGGQAPMWYLLTVYMQNVLHYTPLQAGAGFLPQRW